LHEDIGVDAFVSMETTLEYYDSTKIAKTWKSLDKTMQLHKDDYQIPMLLFANAGKRERFKFWFFEQITHAPMIHASYKKDFGHESYTSIYLIRYLYRKQFKQPDNSSMKKQLRGYVDHIHFIHEFLISKEDMENYQSFEKQFYIKTFEVSQRN